MKRAVIILIGAILLASCETNESCKQKIFGESTWTQDSCQTCYYQNLRMIGNDTIYADGILENPIIFDDDCSGFYILSYHYTITKNTGDIIWFSDGSSTYYFHK